MFPPPPFTIRVLSTPSPENSLVDFTCSTLISKVNEGFTPSTAASSVFVALALFVSVFIDIFVFITDTSVDG